MNDLPSAQAFERREKVRALLDEIGRELKAAGVTLEELPEGGRQVREELFQETHPELAKDLKSSGPHPGYDFGDESCPEAKITVDGFQ